MESRWLSPVHPVNGPILSLARELADPVRLTVLQLLAAEGPQSATGLADQIGISQPRLGNHLARLRAAGLVNTEKHGRHVTYRISHAGVPAVLETLAGYAGGTSPGRSNERLTPLALAHRCYNHAAGRLGVCLLDDAVASGALSPPDQSKPTLDLLPGAVVYFARFDLKLDELAVGRRQAASACLDWLERRPHLSGVLGDAVLASLLKRGLLRDSPDSRVLTPTGAGERELPSLIGGLNLF